MMQYTYLPRLAPVPVSSNTLSLGCMRSRSVFDAVFGAGARATAPFLRPRALAVRRLPLLRAFGATAARRPLSVLRAVAAGFRMFATALVGFSARRLVVEDLFDFLHEFFGQT